MIRLMEIERAIHRDQIAEWLALDHVRCWWGDPEECLSQVDATPDNQQAIIERDGKPIGYMRWEEISSDELAEVELQDIPDGSIDIDLFIGESSEIGNGAGPKALNLLFDHLLASSCAPLAGLCTSVRNVAAHSAFAKAGCRRLTEFDDPDFGPCYVYVRDLWVDRPCCKTSL